VIPQLRIAYLMRYLPAPSETFVLDEAMAVEAAGGRVFPYVLDRMPNAVRHARHEPLYKRCRPVPRASSPRAMIAALSEEDRPGFSMVQSSWNEHARPRDLRRAMWLARAFRRDRVDVIRVHHAAEVARYAVAAGYLAGLPVSVAVHARDLFVPVPDLSWILGGAGLVTTITPFHRARLLRAGLASEKVELLPCPVTMPDGRAQAPATGGALRVLSVGRFVPKKGHDLLLRACAALAGDGVPVELVIIGDGPLWLELSNLARRMVTTQPELSVDLLGAQPVEAVVRELAWGRYHAMALACRVAEDGDRDGVPVALLEAQSWGVPVVTAALPGFDSELFHGEGAHLLPMHEMSNGCSEVDPSEFAGVLAELYRDPSERERMAAAGRARAERRIRPKELGGHLLEMLIRLSAERARLG
jgi:colanic acid/amylovoran biosynthesis glycosyltransferase